VLIAQITDCHVVEPGEVVVDRVDSAAALRRAVATVNRLDGLPAQYDHLVELLAPLEVPLVAVMGNHDDRTELRRRFAATPAGSSDEPIDFVLDDHELRIVVLDTSVPGHHHGQVTAAQMAWLDTRLGEAPDRPTIIVQHHPPFTTGIAFMDAYGLDGADLEADVLARHHQVEALVSGHVHRPVVTRFGGTVASCWPSTAAPVALDLVGSVPVYTDEPAGIALHRYDPATGLVSHLLPLVDDTTTWTPSWAM
jgi:Icc protein